MRRILLAIGLTSLLMACQNDDNVFDESADERASMAITNLKSQLTAPAEGWLLRYRPENESGSYYVLLNFDEENNVRIRTDFGINDGEFYDQTITYRIDNSLGLELIFENYSFFSFLFELDNASFLAEYEFNYVNETPDGALVFRSKTDPSSPTTLVFEPATGNEEANLLGKELSNNLNMLSENALARFATSYRLSYSNRDIVIYLSFESFLRTINFTFVSPDGSEEGQELDFATSYTVENDKIILDEAFSGNFFGQEISIPSISFGELSDVDLTVCGETTEINEYSASINSAPAVLENAIFDPNGANLFEKAEFFFSVNQNIFDESGSLGAQIEEDVEGSLAMILYYDQTPSDPFYALGFFIVNESGTVTRALREFTPTLDGNQLKLEYADDFTVLQDTTGTFNEANVDKYLNWFNEGEGVRIYKVDDNVYELYNTCNDMSFVFLYNQ
ncbi:DUF4302 domain-containing protein [Catalinimonas alkaloidigena]|uniref:DUF4302 domain-containing protein n=1 Tax=Catalinimonas alkaloidigena TaxID=1075417 RepID=UPI002405126D|nr:DUF4302 domain-containing protein [Catalinimonas alkaloidigena]